MTASAILLRVEQWTSRPELLFSADRSRFRNQVPPKVWEVACGYRFDDDRADGVTSS